ncbi:LuxR family transcriptional regulator [Actinomadura darangshiensis]|uniref:LuxR family transcriptional regulator n=1 Tax=Actinomadura darangshiensis TaxID=705336 RepID=A0A4R5BU76_9ACTN|nr:LuxR C-terminal-related transcriptional regulator [Actinomadura darangshiensis]TDD89619.1 LuxR family transcriptional regulator [Actinomadura darangshiensis]
MPDFGAPAPPPTVLTPLVGRDAELRALRDRMLDTAAPLRLFTVTGTVGVGKSRFTMALFQQVSDALADGGRFVDLAPAEPETAAARILGTAGAGTQEETGLAVSRLAGLEFVLAIDHYEHVVDVVAPLVSALLSRCPKVRVLMSGVESLGLYGENVFPLRPLPTPSDVPESHLRTPERIPAVELFVQRALSVRPQFSLTPENVTAVLKLSDMLDGLPLAIEFAAKRTRLVSPPTLVELLDQGIDLLHDSGTAQSFSRHRSMREALDWACAGLTGKEGALLSRLAVFEGEFTLADARAVSGLDQAEIHDVSESLIDRNLLIARERSGGELWLAMLRTTRDYVLGSYAGSADHARARRDHASYFRALVRTAEPALSGPDQARWLRRLARQDAELRAAIRFHLDLAEGGTAAEIAVALRRYWIAAGRLREGLVSVERALVAGGQDGPGKARALLLAGELSALLGEEPDDDGVQRSAWIRLAAARAIYRAADDLLGEIEVLSRLGALLHLRGDLAGAERVLTEGRATGAAGPELLREAAEVVRDLDDLQRAMSLAEDAAAAAARAGDLRESALAEHVRSTVLWRLGETDRARRAGLDALRSLHALGERTELACRMEWQAVMRAGAASGNAGWEQSLRLVAAAERMRDATGMVRPAARAAAVRAVLAEAEARLGAEACAKVRARDEARPPQAVLADLGEPRVSRRSGPLTRREQQVAALVAQGLTNREVGRRLGIAEWTVINHLRKVMRKLDCSSRVQVASYITRQQAEPAGRFRDTG